MDPLGKSSLCVFHLLCFGSLLVHLHRPPCILVHKTGSSEHQVLKCVLQAVEFFGGKVFPPANKRVFFRFLLDRKGGSRSRGGKPRRV
ncbi:hypothetical protein DACRYDRAFT_21626, partial [Dacryopinax primogenitus]